MDKVSYAPRVQRYSTLAYPCAVTLITDFALDRSTVKGEIWFA